AAALLFTDNETNTQRLVHVPNPTPYVKDGINDYIVHGRQGAVNAEKKGTKASAHCSLNVGAGESRTLRLRLSDVAPAIVASTTDGPGGAFGNGFDAAMESRRQEADEFYACDAPGDRGHALVQAVLLL
ncbi:MAG: putative (alpha/alpha)-barrel-type glycoside hydrolase, partial [Acidobacteria bacterium]|nr:putative (alpha/alpha)-barrel-type glycoside hydrolase [Acidobacteriota bacterium]